MDFLRNIYRKHIRIVPGVKSYVVATALIFLFGIIITFFAWYADKQRAEEQAALELNQQVDSVTNVITNRLSVYEQIMRAGTGLFMVNDKVSKSTWETYNTQFDVANSYPGISGIGYAEIVPASGLDTFLQRHRAETDQAFSVWPSGQRASYTPIVYIKTANGQTPVSIGYDIQTNPVRRDAMKQARDSGNVVISDNLVLVPDALKQVDKPTGFGMYAAIYNGKADTIEDRQKNVTGYVFASFRSDTFFSEVLKNANFRAYKHIAVFDSSTMNKDSLIYASSDYAKGEALGTSPPTEVTFFGRTWTLEFSEPVNPGAQTERSLYILGAGILSSLIVSGLLFAVMFIRARDIIYLKQQETQQAKDDLLSLASHQLRTPATATKQYVGMVLEGYMGDISEKQRSALQKAYISNERQLEIINQILYVAKADAGRISINPTKFDLNQLVEDIVHDVRDTLKERDQSIRLKKSRKRMQITADEVSMRMVIENLVSNASKYSHKGGVISVRTGSNLGQAFVSVTDKGVGIHPNDRDKLFKKFSRIDNELSVQVGGSGIGLYIDKVLIELHGGTINVESEYGKGSTFTIQLPKKHARNLTDRHNGSG
jgi:signal transduction histidine kinase